MALDGRAPRVARIVNARQRANSRLARDALGFNGRGYLSGVLRIFIREQRSGSSARSFCGLTFQSELLAASFTRIYRAFDPWSR